MACADAPRDWRDSMRLLVVPIIPCNTSLMRVSRRSQIRRRKSGQVRAGGILDPRYSMLAAGRDYLARRGQRRAIGRMASTPPMGKVLKQQDILRINRWSQDASGQLLHPRSDEQGASSKPRRSSPGDCPNGVGSADRDRQTCAHVQPRLQHGDTGDVDSGKRTNAPQQARAVRAGGA